MKISLMVLSAGNSAGKTLPINTLQFVIGRDPQCNLRPASAMISKRHCAVSVKDGQVFVQDFNSTNGTFVNDEQLQGEIAVKDGDTLKLGPLCFKLVIEGAPMTTKSRPPTKPNVEADLSEEDAAAAMLSVDDETSDVGVGAEPDNDSEVPGGSTIMEMPTVTPPPGAAFQEEKLEAKKPEAKKPVAGAAQSAAQAILEKLRQGKRK